MTAHDEAEIARAIVHEHFGKHEEFDALTAAIAAAFAACTSDAVAAERERCAKIAETTIPERVGISLSRSIALTIRQAPR